MTQWRQLVSCDWSSHSRGSPTPGEFDLKINRGYKNTVTEIQWSCMLLLIGSCNSQISFHGEHLTFAIVNLFRSIPIFWNLHCGWQKTLTWKTLIFCAYFWSKKNSFQWFRGNNHGKRALTLCWLSLCGFFHSQKIPGNLFWDLNANSSLQPEPSASRVALQKNGVSFTFQEIVGTINQTSSLVEFQQTVFQLIRYLFRSRDRKSWV